MNVRNDRILDQIIDGLGKLERQRTQAKLGNVTVALITEDGIVIGTYPLSEALCFVRVGAIHDLDGLDITARYSAEVLASLDERGRVDA